LNALTLRFMQYQDGLQGLCDAALAQALNTSNPQIAGLRREIKVLSLPLLIQRCVGHGIDPGGIIKTLMEHALNPFDSRKSRQQPAHFPQSSLDGAAPGRSADCHHDHPTGRPAEPAPFP
jgi:hypothetical protein